VREAQKDNNNRLIGYFEEEANGDIKVYDHNSRFRGTATDEGTFDHNHRRISQSKIPGLLLED
jgi:hypothetical protein